MSRVIKFRVWDIMTSKMIPWEAIKSVWGADVLENRYVMQFIGLKDKNGKEIYEGDVIKWFHGEEDFGVVEYFDEESDFFGWMEQCYFGIHLKDTNVVTLFQEDDEYEVVGNVYENPDLIK